MQKNLIISINIAITAILTIGVPVYNLIKLKCKPNPKFAVHEVWDGEYCLVDKILNQPLWTLHNL
jgi:hypothetical protein